MSSKVLPLILSVSAWLSVVRGDSLLIPCRTDDVECLSKSTRKFLSNTCKGIPEYDIRPIDPMIIESTDFEAPGGQGTVFRFKNLKVTGLKDQKFSDFKMDTSKKEVVLTTNADINIVGDVMLELSEKAKTFSGTFALSGSVAGTASYGYSFKKDDKGVTHYEVGSEKITCEVSGEPNVEIASQLDENLNADPEFQAIRREKNQDRLLFTKEILCHVTEKAYATVIHNIRAAAKILPTTSFLIGV